jgi:MFS transporter, DHA1 family, multidrug resistance protein
MTEAASQPRLTATVPVIALLTAISTLGSLATSIYLPSMPTISTVMQASPAAVQHTLTAYLAAFAAGQLLFGPLSDRFGRRRVMLTGFVIYVAASLACALAGSLGLLIGARIVQAIGACAGMVVSRAMVRDAFDGPQMTKVLTAIGVASAAIPAVAPLLGGVLEQLLGWRSAFFVATAIGVVVAALALANLPETNRRPLARLDGIGILRAYLPVVRSRHFLACALISASGFGALFAFLSGSPHVMIDVIGISPAEYGIYPPIAIIGLVIGGVLTGRLAGRVRERRLVAIGLALLAIGAVSMPFSVMRPVTITISMFIFSAGMSVLMPVCTAAAIRPFADRAGTASALIGFLQMVVGAAGSATAAMAQGLGVYAFPATMVGMTGFGVLVFLGLARTIDFR